MAGSEDLILRRGVFAVSRDEGSGGLETAQGAPPHHEGATPRMAGNSKFTLAECPEPR